MPSYQWYSLFTFKRLGRSNFSQEYAIVDNKDLYTFQWKNYYDEDGDVQRVKMLRVGGYHYKNDGLPAWAYADGACIQYFSGLETVVETIKKELESKIYYKKPFRFFSGPQDGRGMTRSRIFGKTSTEAIILFLFLRFSVLNTVWADSEVLRHFELACLNYETNRKVYEEAQAIKPTQEYDSEDEVKEEYFSDDDVPSNSMACVQDTAQSYGTSRASFSVSTVMAIEEQVCAELSGEKTQLEKEIKALKKDLQEQKYRTSIANTTHSAERARRKTAEKDARTAQDDLAKQRNLVAEWRNRAKTSEEEAAVLQAESDEWKEKWEGSQAKSADYQMRFRQLQKASRDYQAKLSKSQEESQNWSKQYTSLKRKLKGLTEDDAEPIKKTSRR